MTTISSLFGYAPLRPGHVVDEKVLIAELPFALGDEATDEIFRLFRVDSLTYQK